MSEKTRHIDPAKALAQEQSIADLEQVLGARAQLRGDRDQARFEYEQTVLDADRGEAGEAGATAAGSLDDRQGRLDRAQAGRNADQQGLDASQGGRDAHQQSLDELRGIHDLPIAQRPAPVDEMALRREAVERAKATSDRAQASLLRAQDALRRAEASEERLDNEC